MCKLSIVIPNYNYGRFADRFFSSIAAQTFPLENVEIIFVDDGSSDDSLERAEEWSRRLSCSRFVILNPLRCGKPGPVRNFGLEKASGDLLVCIDPDDILYPGYLETCMGFLQDNPGIDLVYTDYIEQRPENFIEMILPQFKPLFLRTQNPVPPSAVFRRWIWERGARYRDNTVYEDWDFWIQCLMMGARFRHIPEILYSYEIHESNFSHRAVRDDGPAKAQIVLNNPSFFHHTVVQWAQDHMRGRDYAPAFQRGYIPTAEDIMKVMELFHSKTDISG